MQVLLRYYYNIVISSYYNIIKLSYYHVIILSYYHIIMFSYYHIIEGSLEVKLPTIWTDEKQSRAEAERRGRLAERRSEEKESEERRCRCAKR